MRSDRGSVATFLLDHMVRLIKTISEYIYDRSKSDDEEIDLVWEAAWTKVQLLAVMLTTWVTV